MGAFLAGFCADQFGRKPTTVASLALVGLGNFGLTFFAALNPWTAIGLFTLIGAASGGYMVDVS
jgi:MFS family permease